LPRTPAPPPNIHTLHPPPLPRNQADTHDVFKHVFCQCCSPWPPSQPQHHVLVGGKQQRPSELQPARWEVQVEHGVGTVQLGQSALEGGTGASHIASHKITRYTCVRAQGVESFWPKAAATPMASEGFCTVWPSWGVGLGFEVRVSLVHMSVPVCCAAALAGLLEAIARVCGGGRGGGGSHTNMAPCPHNPRMTVLRKKPTFVRQGTPDKLRCFIRLCLMPM